jgi:gamma-glutamylcyclotransferase (GGCT)/AIG2-like uncharacterized protein YtfP
MKYFAYGMNTNLASMRERCPTARCLGYAQLLDFGFRFATHADVVPKPGSVVHGVMWELEIEDLRSLDLLEGYPHYYERDAFPVRFQGQVYDTIVYYMTPGFADTPPPESYLRMLEQGYEENLVPQSQIWEAFERTLPTPNHDSH